MTQIDQPRGAATPSHERVVLVDEADRPMGEAEKIAAHVPPGLLHRAVSVFVFDQVGKVLLQRRATSKYHFPRLWSNSCCTHPEPDETVVAAGERRVVEELGVRTELVAAGVFTYRAVDHASGLVEYEVDHVLVGRTLDPPTPDPMEVSEIALIDLEELQAALQDEPTRFTPWLPGALAVLLTSSSVDWTTLGFDHTDEAIPEGSVDQ